MEIAELGQPIIRKVAKEVVTFDDKLQTLINDMIATMLKADGVGIAAPQVFKNLKLFVVASRPNARYPHAPIMDPLAVINPEIVSPHHSGESRSRDDSRISKNVKRDSGRVALARMTEQENDIIKDWEGCLSIPGIRGIVPRFEAITIQFTTRNGKNTTKTFTGFVARIFQHEYDHINGKVFLDRVENTKDIVTEREYKRIISQKTPEMS